MKHPLRLTPQGIAIGIAIALLLALVVLPRPANGAAASDCAPWYTTTLRVAGHAPGRIGDCTGTCTFRTTWACGPVLFFTLHATPGPGAYFAGWSGSCHGTGDCTLSLVADHDVTATFEPYAPQGVDLSVTQSVSPAPGLTGRDVVFSLQVTNTGPATATGVTLADTLPAGAGFVWASPGCARTAGQVNCAVGAIATGSSATVHVVVRPANTGMLSNAATASTPMIESDYTNNAASAAVDVAASPPGQVATRWRLFGELTGEHLFTMSEDEYRILGANPQAWRMEGAHGNLLDNPGTFGGVTAVPCYRLFQSERQLHHWTTDANEYYTLVQFPDWVGEGIDGFILPTQAPGSIPLYRLLYPFVEGLHHWTIDPVEYAILIADYGWLAEPGTGFVIP